MMSFTCTVVWSLSSAKGRCFVCKVCNIRFLTQADPCYCVTPDVKAHTFLAGVSWQPKSVPK